MEKNWGDTPSAILTLISIFSKTSCTHKVHHDIFGNFSTEFHFYSIWVVKIREGK